MSDRRRPRTPIVAGFGANPPIASRETPGYGLDPPATGGPSSAPPTSPTTPRRAGRGATLADPEGNELDVIAG